MALTARETKGFELIGNLHFQPSPPRAFEMTPSTTVTEGDMVVMTLNKVAAAAASAKNILGVAAETVTSHATEKTDIRVHINPYNIYRCTFKDHLDSTATGSGTSTTIVDSTLGGTDNFYRGGLLFIYEGAGLGAIRTISAYGQAAKTLTWIEPLTVSTGTTTKYILLRGHDTADMGINVGSIGVELKNKSQIDADATIENEAGPLVVIGADMPNLTLDVLVRKSLFATRAAGH